MNFSQALDALKAGQKVARENWNAHHTLGLQTPDENSANTLPYIFMVVGGDATDLQGKRVPWVASHTDLLSEDWGIMPAPAAENEGEKGGEGEEKKDEATGSEGTS